MGEAGGPLGPAKAEGRRGRQDELGLLRLPGFREMALRRMAGERRRLVGELTAQRQAAGLSQTQVAARMGTSQSAVARLEAGGADVRASTLERYAAAIGSQISWRLQDSPPAGQVPRLGSPRPPRSSGRKDRDRRTPMTVPAADSFPPGRPWPGPHGQGPGPDRRPGPAVPGSLAVPGRPAGQGRPAGPRRTGSRPRTLDVPPSRVWTDQGDWPGQVYQRLLEQRIVMASGLLDGAAASVLSAQLLTLDAEGDGPVRLELQGLTAELPAALTVMGVLDVLRAPVTGYVAGQVSGPALGLLAACGQRCGYPSAMLGLTEPRLSLGGTATQVRGQEEQVETMVDTLYIRLAEVTGREVDEIRADARRGRFLTVPEAVAYGLLDSQAGPGDRPGGSRHGGRIAGRAADRVARAEAPVTAAGTRGVHPGEHLAGRAAAAARDPAVPGPGRVRAVGADRA